ncbi:MAG TPA: SRPBCC family protein [Candidatus Saccharimonadales bacterium]|nr:SRPBCC family protein [Candidatus Saccharimonadales bacterium]
MKSGKEPALPDARVSTQVTIAATPANVWRYLSELKYHYLWNPHLTHLSPLGSLKPGSTYSATSLLFGIKIKALNKVIKLKPSKQLVIQNDNGTLIYIITYTLSPQGKKTLLKCRISVRPQHPAFAFAAPVLETFARHELQADLQSLKVAVEQKLG